MSSLTFEWLYKQITLLNTEIERKDEIIDELESAIKEAIESWEKQDDPSWTSIDKLKQVLYKIKRSK